MGGSTRGTRPNYTGTASVSYRSNLNYYNNQQTVSSDIKRAFISFHIEDEAQVDLLRHQAKDDRFDLEFTDYSVKEPFDERWKTQCTERIRQSDVVIVMLGIETYKREAVLWEIEKAYELGKPVVGVRIHKDRKDRIPEPMIRHGAKIINWKINEIQGTIDETNL